MANFKIYLQNKNKCFFLDYDAPVSEGGNLNKKKYHLFKDIIHRNSNLGIRYFNTFTNLQLAIVTLLCVT